MAFGNLALKDTIRALSKAKGHLAQSVATWNVIARLGGALQSQSLQAYPKSLNFQEPIFGRSPQQSASKFVADIQLSKNGNRSSPLEIGEFFVEGMILGANAHQVSRGRTEHHPVHVCAMSEEVWADAAVLQWSLCVQLLTLFVQLTYVQFDSLKA